jgi:hypothetical protein
MQTTKKIKTIQARLEVIVTDIDLLVEELQEQYENMSEKVQEGAKGEALAERIANLEEWRDNVSDITEEAI